MGKGNGAFALYTTALNQYTNIWDQDGIHAVSHDSDGNQLTKGTQEYTWDAENRLIEVRERGSLRARYIYDSQSPRIARWISDGLDERYLYQGWNLINIYNASHAEPVESYTWGKDLNGSFQGAGGVGGLLFGSGEKPGDDWFYHYDANGNVRETTDARATINQAYSYDEFGNLNSIGQGVGNRFRFSTKFQDDETGYFYYGYRYFDSSSGRWLSKDPMEESGGLNLFEFVNNDTQNYIDILGLVKYRGIFGAHFLMDLRDQGVSNFGGAIDYHYLTRDVVDEWATINYDIDITCSSEDVPTLNQFSSSGPKYGGGSEIDDVTVTIRVGTSGDLLNLTEAQREFFQGQRYVTIGQGMMEYEVRDDEVSLIVNAMGVGSKVRNCPSNPLSVLGPVPVFGPLARALSSAWGFVAADSVQFEGRGAMAFKLYGCCKEGTFVELDRDSSTQNSGLLNVYANLIEN